jgi:Autotransporter beta-domain
LGFRASYTLPAGSVSIIPSLTAAWEHEYLYCARPITVSSPAFPGPSTTFSGPNEGHDSAIVNAGVATQRTPTFFYHLHELSELNVLREIIVNPGRTAVLAEQGPLERACWD